MPKCIAFLPCDWLISYFYYQAIDQVYLIKCPVSVYVLYIEIVKKKNVFLDAVTDECFSVITNLLKCAKKTTMYDDILK